jgi:hypothetical protein
MASTYSALKIELITTGEQTGTWGGTTNTNLGTALEEAIVGRATVNFTSDANLTISLTNTNATQVARNYILNVTSGVSLTATRNLVVPSINKPYIIENNTTGGQSIVVKTAAGTGVTVPNGKRTMVYANTTNVVAAENHIPDLTLGAALPVASGGTGITSFGAGIATFLGTPSSANLAAALTDETGSGANVFATSPTLVTPILGTPTSGNLANCTFPTLNQNTSGTAAGLSATLVATSGGTGQSSYAVGDVLYASTTTALSKLADVATGNALISGGVGVAPSYGKIGLTTHVSGTLPVANGGTGITSFGTGVATALGVNVGSAGAPVVNGGVLGTPSSGTLTSCTGLPISTGVSGLATGAATFLGTPSSANLAALLTDETGTGANVFATSPTLAGTPLAPTAAAGTNTTQISTTAFVTAAIQTLHPVGSIYTSTVATNPATLFGFGTWVAFGAGRVMIGDGGGFAAGATGGSADAVVVAHTHTGTTSTTTTLTGAATFISETWANAGTGTGVFSKVGLNPAAGTPTSTDTSNAGQLNINANHNHTFTTDSTGVSATNANLQPYVVVYMWNRTA